MSLRRWILVESAELVDERAEHDLDGCVRHRGHEHMERPPAASGRIGAREDRPGERVRLSRPGWPLDEQDRVAETFRRSPRPGAEVGAEDPVARPASASANACNDRPRDRLGRRTWIFVCPALDPGEECVVRWCCGTRRGCARRRGRPPSDRATYARPAVTGIEALWPNRNSLFRNDIGISSTVISSPSIDCDDRDPPAQDLPRLRSVVAGTDHHPVAFLRAHLLECGRRVETGEIEADPEAAAVRRRVLERLDKQRRAARDASFDRQREQREQAPAASCDARRRGTRAGRRPAARLRCSRSRRARAAGAAPSVRTGSAP